MPEMQTLHDESGEGAGGTGAGEAARVDARTDRVELRGGGWPGAVARVQDFTLQSRFRKYGELAYVRVAVGALVLNHAPAILVMQGLLLQDLFAPDTFFAFRGEVLARGPFVLLRGTLSTPQDPPLRLKDVVLAAVERAPAGMTREEVLATLLEEELR